MNNKDDNLIHIDFKKRGIKEGGGSTSTSDPERFDPVKNILENIANKKRLQADRDKNNTKVKRSHRLRSDSTQQRSSKKRVDTLSFEDAQKYALHLDIKSHVQWRIWHRRGLLAPGLPLYPEFEYRGRGWKGWKNFCGKSYTYIDGEDSSKNPRTSKRDTTEDSFEGHDPADHIKTVWYRYSDSLGKPGDGDEETVASPQGKSLGKLRLEEELLPDTMNPLYVYARLGTQLEALDKDLSNLLEECGGTPKHRGSWMRECETQDRRRENAAPNNRKTSRFIPKQARNLLRFLTFAAIYIWNLKSSYLLSIQDKK
mgnify:CR=1 FL=1